MMDGIQQSTITTAATMTEGQQATVATPCLAYNRMAEKWKLIDDLLGGTEAMRAAAETWLPKESKEDDVAYKARLRRSFLYSAFADTVDKIVSKPFAQAVVLEGEDKLPEQLQGMSKNIDRAGTSLAQFFKDVFESGVQKGHCCVLVDYPSMVEAAPSNLAEERQMDVRPYLVKVDANNLIGWTTEKQPNGQLKLIQIRIRECEVVKDGDWGEKAQERIRVINTDTWQIWAKNSTSNKWEVVEEGEHTFGEVPLKVFYTDKRGFLESDPPLQDLAELNLCHWQSYSDQRNILRFARVGMLFAAGFSEEEIEKGVYVGPSQLVSSVNPQATLSYVEHGGSAIQAGRDDLKDLEERMEVLGLQPLIARGSASTATGKMIDENRTATDIQTWIRDLEILIVDCYKAAAQWIGQELSDDAIKVNILDTFDLMANKDGDIAKLTDLAKSNKLSDRTLLTEIKRRGLLQETVDVDEEIQRIQDQGPALGDLGKLLGQPAKPGEPGKGQPPAPGKGQPPAPGKGQPPGKPAKGE